MKRKLLKTVAISSGLLLLGFTHANAQTTQTFTYTGSMQSFTVPPCVAQVTLTVKGASGANGATAPVNGQSNGALGGNGGLGASVSGVYPVTNGQVFNIYVGGAASGAVGGYNGGGTGNQSSGGGGGASDIRVGGTALSNRIIVAGGGGGGGNGGCTSFTITGGDGGASSGNGTAGVNSQAGGGGQGANGSTGGSPGTGCPLASGTVGVNGTPGIGGNGGPGPNICSAYVSGGAGGGGYVGGGGGGGGTAGTTSCTLNDQGGGGGGAGGSNYFDPAFTSTVITNGIVSGPGSVIVTYSVGTPPAMVSATSATIAAGSSATLTASGATTYSWSTTATTQTIIAAPTSTTVYTVTGYDVPGCGTSATTTVTVFGAALNFDGNDDYVNIPDDPSLNISGPITIESWVYATKNSGVQNVISKSNNVNNNGYIFPRTDDGWNTFVAYFTINGSWQTLSAPFAGLNQWHHLATTYDGTYIRLYQDGILAATSPAYPGSITLNSNNLALGVQPGFAEFFGGSADECRIWNRALCKEEIQNNMNGEVNVNANGLVAYYKFNQGFDNTDNTSITSVLDVSSGSNSGTPNNFSLTGPSSNFKSPGGVMNGNMVPAFSNTLSAVATQTNVANCYGDATGSANMAVTGIESPFTYTWTSGGNAATENNLAAGTYTCTIGNGCGTITQTVTITQPTQLTVTATPGTIACNGGATTVSVSASGGTPTYSNTGTYTVTANSYTYTVTDANSCSATTTITVSEPSAITTTQSPTLCAGASLVVGTNTYTTAGTYTNVLAAVNGCDSTVTTNLSFYNAIDVSVTVSSTTMTANNATATSYQWLDCNLPNPIIIGATQQTYVAPANGNYQVQITEGSCSDTSTCITISNVGISQNSKAASIQAHPNPFSGELTITSSVKTKAFLFDVLGNQVHSFDLQNATQTIMLDHLTAGIYYLQVDQQKIKVIKK